MGGFAARWDRFFFREEAPYGLALTRILAPWALLVAAIPRWPRVRELFSTDGAPTPVWEGYGLTDMLPTPNGTLAVALYTAMLCLLVAISIGWQTRWSAFIGGGLYVWFGMLDSVSTLTKYTAIGAHVFLLLSLSNCGAVWSVDAWLDRRRASSGVVLAPRSPVWPRRLLQLLVGIVYLGSAATKMHTPAYFSGDQLMYWMITDVNFDNPLGEALAIYPALLVVIAYVTIVWELLFVFLCWRGVSRVALLALGVVFHASTWFTLGLLEFPLLYGAIYCAFLDETEIDRLRCWRRRVWNRLIAAPRRAAIRPRPDSRRIAPLPGAVAYAAVLVAAMGVGVAAERRLDPYGLRSADGMLALQPVAPDRLAQLLAPEQPLRPADKLFALDVGTQTVGGVLANRRHEFDYGEKAIIQCSLQPMHEDMWVEVNLHDAADRIIERNGVVVPRENLRGTFHYKMDPALLPGEYSLVLRFDGQEVQRRQIRIRDDGGRARQASAAATVLTR